MPTALAKRVKREVAKGSAPQSGRVDVISALSLYTSNGGRNWVARAKRAVGSAVRHEVPPPAEPPKQQSGAPVLRERQLLYARCSIPCPNGYDWFRHLPNQISQNGNGGRQLAESPLDSCASSTWACTPHHGSPSTLRVPCMCGWSMRFPMVRPSVHGWARGERNAIIRHAPSRRDATRHELADMHAAGLDAYCRRRNMIRAAEWKWRRPRLLHSSTVTGRYVRGVVILQKSLLQAELLRRADHCGVCRRGARLPVHDTVQLCG